MNLLNSSVVIICFNFEVSPNPIGKSYVRKGFFIANLIYRNVANLIYRKRVFKFLFIVLRLYYFLGSITKLYAF